MPGLRPFTVPAALLGVVAVVALVLVLVTGPEPGDGSRPFVPEVAVASEVPELPPRPASDPDDGDNDELDDELEQGGPDHDDRDDD